MLREVWRRIDNILTTATQIRKRSSALIFSYPKRAFANFFDRAALIVDSPEGSMAQKSVWKELSEKLELIQPSILKNI